MTPILGVKSCKDMGFIKFLDQDIAAIQEEELTMEVIMRKYQDVFTGLGCFEKDYDIKIEESETPVVHAPRKVPFALKDKLKQTLDQMCTAGIITPVSEATDWVSSLVLVDSPKKLRICLDPKDLNNAIKRPHYPMPVIEDMLPEIVDAKVFSVVDAKDGFW